MEKETYTIQEVMSLITSLPFQKFSHPYFSDDEYIYGDGKGHLLDEGGYHLPQDEFWRLRMNEPNMQYDWYMWSEKKEEPSQETEKQEKTKNMSEIEIQELYTKAKEIIKKFPNKAIKVSSFNIVQPDPYGEREGQRVDYVQLIKSKLDYLHQFSVDGKPWVAHLTHLPAELRRDLLKKIIETYEKI